MVAALNMTFFAHSKNYIRQNAPDFNILQVTVHLLRRSTTAVDLRDTNIKEATNQ
jgi:hypothetical protein